MSEPWPPEHGWQPILRALAEAVNGRPVDYAALRARLVHLGDQNATLASSVDAEWDSGELGAVIARDLASVVDRMEAGRLRAAGRRLAAVLRLHYGFKAGVNWAWFPE